MVVVRTFTEMSELQASLRTLDVKGVALHADRFAGSVSTIDFDDVCVEIVKASPALLFKAATKGRCGRLLLLEGAQGARWDGTPAHVCDVASLQPDRALAVGFNNPFRCAFISTKSDQADQLLGIPQDDSPGQRAVIAIHRSSAASHRRLADLIRAAEKGGMFASDASSEREDRRSLPSSLLNATKNLCAPCAAERTRKSMAGARQCIVRRVDEHLCANSDRSLYTEELCEVVGASASALHEAFHAVFGISPHRYLKLRRMSLVRAALLSQAGPWRSVKAAALSYGFWHLGQFAHDYRHTYGELPSATLARAKFNGA